MQNLLDVQLSQLIIGLLFVVSWTASLWFMRPIVRSWTGRLRLGFCIGAWVLSTILCYMVLGVFNWPSFQDDATHLDYSLQLLYEARLAIAIFSSLFAMNRFLGEPTLLQIGLPIIPGQRRRYLGDVAFGLLLGPLALGAVLLTGIISGWFHLAGLTPLNEALASLLWGVGLFVLVGVVEEITTRGGLLAGLSKVVGSRIALVISIMTFTVLHAGNPGVSLLALVSTAIAGLVFGFALLRTSALWLPISFHASWDWAETSLYGFRDSGLPAAGLLHTLVNVHAPDWLTGGTFGPEASLPVILITLASAGAIAFYTRNRDPNWG